MQTTPCLGLGSSDGQFPSVCPPGIDCRFSIFSSSSSPVPGPEQSRRCNYLPRLQGHIGRLLKPSVPLWYVQCDGGCLISFQHRDPTISRWKHSFAGRSTTLGQPPPVSVSQRLVVPSRLSHQTTRKGRRVQLQSRSACSHVLSAALRCVR